jgi:outer membrane protein
MKNLNQVVMKPILSLFLGIVVSCGLYAQKFGHVNTAQILEIMPEVDIADKQLAAFQEGLIKGGEAKAATFEADYKKYLDDVNSGVLSKVQQTDRETTLTKQQQEIQQYERQVQLQVLQKREELLKPILQKIDEAIQAEGKEGQYTFIFDSSVQGALLYAPDADDLMAAVKKRLGLQ